MSKGIFVTLEGPDGSGKSTQIEYLKEYFQNHGIQCVFTREPGGTDIGEKLRDIILDKDNNEMSDMTEALLYAASRAQHVSELIKPSLDAGKAVICDRYVDSSIAYQGYGRGLGESVQKINEYAIFGCMPDITFLIEIDPKVGKHRIKAGEQDRLEREKLQFHDRVYEGYKEMAKLHPERIVPVDGTGSREQIREEIARHLDKLLSDRNI